MLLPFIFALGAPSDNSVKLTITKRYRQIEAAFSTRKGEKLAALLAPDYMSVSMTGSSNNRETILENFAALAGAGNQVRLVDQIQSITIKGNEVRVSYHSTLHAHVKGRDKKEHTIEVTANEIDTWSLYGKDWKISKTVFKSFEGKKDGVVQQPG